MILPIICETLPFYFSPLPFHPGEYCFQRAVLFFTCLHTSCSTSHCPCLIYIYILTLQLKTFTVFLYLVQDIPLSCSMFHILTMVSFSPIPLCLLLVHQIIHIFFCRLYVPAANSSLFFA